VVYLPELGRFIGKGNVLMKERLKILNIWVDPLTKSEALQRVHEFLKFSQRPHAIFASNPEKNFSVANDPEVYRIFAQAGLLLPDGIGIVLAARLLYGVKLQRIPGVEFMEDICQLATQKGYKIFFYGAREEVNRKSVEVMDKRYPGLVAGRAHGYNSQAEMPDLIKQINESQADILFLALGSPKQEKWYAAYQDSLKHVRVVQGIGGTLDTIAGTVPRAPKSWRKAHAEWLYRLLNEPKRLNRQKVLPLFMFKVVNESLKSLSKRKNHLEVH
jgi:N-acetylglucosaminyldiphosphoundecaprenol N-acetyl-beta-D-mannosaminyltransferase